MKTNSTQQSLKKYFYSGVGHISHTGDIILKSTRELARQGKTNEADGKKIVSDAVEQVERKYNETLHKLIALTRSEVAMLKARLGKMEKQIGLNPQKLHTQVGQRAKI